MMTFRPIRFALTCLAGSLLTLGVARAIEEGTSPQASPPPKVPAGMVEIVRENRDPADGPAKVVVIPVQDQIAKPVLFVIRRGLKEAIRDEADLVVLDMKTPGGSLGVTFEIMEALEKFDGATATFIDDEAISAGAFISAMTDDIYFAPDGVIGAAAPVTGGGGDIDETMKQKIVSYLKARIRALSEGHPYRGEVISAMIDADHVLEIEGEVLKGKGELLSLTASEAARTYGDPPQPLLAAGVADSVESLLDARYGPEGYELTTLETTWSEELAALLTAMAPVLMGLGLLGLFIEFKTPGFGVFGLLGGLLLVIVFFGHHVAGLSGNEPMLFFFLGVLLVLVELLFFPGVFVFALSGIVLMLGSLVWSMADFWPNEPISFSGDVFIVPLQNVGLALVVAIVGGVALLRFLPRGWFLDKVILSAAVGDGSKAARQAEVTEEEALIGVEGEAATDLFPSGQVVIDGQWHDAKVAVGTIEKGTPVRVTGRDGFSLLVKAIEEDEV
jgi:membrane-bound serine protease (ClpP class)